MPVSSRNDHRVLPSDSSNVLGQLARIESDESMFITRRRIVEHIYGPLLETFGADCPDHSIPQTRVRPDEFQGQPKGNKNCQVANRTGSVSPQIAPASAQHRYGEEQAWESAVTDEQPDGRMISGQHAATPPD